MRDPTHELLSAEVAAWPLAAPLAYDLCLTTLEWDGGGRPARGTRDLAHDLEAYIRPLAGGMSIAMLEHLRDGAWCFGQPGVMRSTSLARYLVRLAGARLEHHGNQIILRPEPLRHGVEAVGWRWLSLSLPPDLLVAGLCAERGAPVVTDIVSVTPPALRETLRQPVAVGHLHLGAACHFGALWTGLMSRWHDPRVAPVASIRNDADVPFAAPDRFVTHLGTVAVVRLLLASFLHERLQGATGHQTFEEFWIRGGGDAIARRLAQWRPHALERDILDRVLRQLRTGRSDVSAARLRSLFRRLTSGTRQPSHAGIRSCDPLAAVSSFAAASAHPETLFAATALRHLLHTADDGFAALFWQYQRVRCMTYRYLVQRPWTGGLDWFQRHYGRIAALRAPLDGQMYRSALELESTATCLGALEVRQAPTAPPGWATVVDDVEAFAAQAAAFRPRDGLPRPEIGLIYHLIKRVDCGCGRLQNDPSHKAYPNRFGPWFRESERHVVAMTRALDRYPRLLVLLRGIDVASVELAVPSWVLAPLFARLDNAARRASARLATLEPTWEVPPLRHTIHVGEDFRRLVEGMRRVHEAVEFGLLRPGDRIGHGVALGVSADTWAARALQVEQPIEDRLDDLLWEMARYRAGDWPPDGSRLEYLRSEIARLGRTIYASEVTLDTLLAARTARHDTATLRRVDFPHARCDRSGGTGTVDAVLRRHLADPGVYERGRMLEVVTASDQEIAMLHAAQRWLQNLLGRNEITIESNPSSNLLIADLGRIEEHPFFALQRAAETAPHASMPGVSLNDDDPITFATRIDDEYGYLHAALLRRDWSTEAAITLANGLREVGWRSRFTLRPTRRKKVLNALGRRTRSRPGTSRANRRTQTAASECEASPIPDND